MTSAERAAGSAEPGQVDPARGTAARYWNTPANRACFLGVRPAMTLER